jgi:hypothetical protein
MIWDYGQGKWITPVFTTEDDTTTAHSLIAMASPVSETNVAQLLAPQTQINVYAQPQVAPALQVVSSTPQVLAHSVTPQVSSIASLFHQLGAQMVALESRVSALETTV